MSGDLLAEICAAKRELVARRKAKRPFAEVMCAAKAAPGPRGFARKLSDIVAREGLALIGEIKKASPSQGLIRADFNPAALARAYARGGAACLSVLTDEPYFQGRDEDLVAARTAVDLPMLRKDFILDPYQVAESRALGADCVLLILAALDDAAARSLAAEAGRLGMDVLAEVHDAAELERALLLDFALIGVNNRNLRTLEVDLGTTERLAKRIPPGRDLVCESGLHSHDDLLRMSRAGARRFLVGESLMRQKDVAAATAALLGRSGAAERVRAR